MLLLIWEFNLIKLRKDVNVKRLSVRKNIANALILGRPVASFVNVMDAKIVEFYNI